jgi:hypothetical protein
MRRILVILSATVVVLLAGGFVALGAFPPKAPAHPVHVSVPTGTPSPA